MVSTGGAWLLICNALDTATYLSASVNEHAQAEGTPWLADRGTVRVERGDAAIALRCGEAAPCRGSAELTSVGTGRHLGAAAYQNPAGGDARLRFGLPDVAQGTTHARLTLRESGGSTGSAEITLRRR